MKRPKAQHENERHAPFLLRFEVLGEGGALGRHNTLHARWHRPPSGRVVVRIDLCASEPTVALVQFSFDALELSSAATELLKQ